ncbi:MAG: hypothetical protein LBS16_04420, partial [Prevotellaceae bacterium]|nr:hypothetical protein [Prevotellaceae bacterium]
LLPYRRSMTCGYENSAFQADSCIGYAEGCFVAKLFLRQPHENYVLWLRRFFNSGRRDIDRCVT